MSWLDYSERPREKVSLERSELLTRIRETLLPAHQFLMELARRSADALGFMVIRSRK